MIDLDYNATTPLRDEVRRAMQPYLGESYGNPSSLHRIGQRTRAAVENAREAIAGSAGADPEQLVITASGSEANTFALRGLVRPPYANRSVVTTAVEHSSVRDTAKWMERQGARVEYAPVDGSGQLEPDWFRRHLTPEVDLVSVMMVNNETGVIYPTREIGEICREKGILFHVDAVQAYGKIKCSYRDHPADLMTISAHKVGGPKGVGALFAPRDLEMDPLVFGGHQERDRRGGTENVPAVVGFGEAARNIDPEGFARVAARRDALERAVRERISDVMVVGRQTERVANTSGLLFAGVEGENVVMRLDMEDVGAATGSACTSGSAQPSHVIRATPLPEGYSAGSFLRLSLPPDPPDSVPDGVVNTLASVVQELRSQDPSQQKYTRQLKSLSNRN